MLPLPFPAASISLGYGGVDGKYYTASSPHLGTDFSSRSRGIVAGCVFRASGAGRVVRSGVGPVGVSPTMIRPNSLAGNSIDVDYGNVITRYMHRPYDSPSPAVGAAVVEGTVLGVIGNTGLSGGAHLHMETWDKRTGRRVNPAAFFDFTRTVTSGSTAGGGATPFDPEEDDMNTEQDGRLRNIETIVAVIKQLLTETQQWKGIGALVSETYTTVGIIKQLISETESWTGLDTRVSQILAAVRDLATQAAGEAARDAALAAAIEQIAKGQGIDPAALAQTVTDAAKAGAVAALDAVKFPDADVVAQQVTTQQERARLASLQAEVDRLTGELAQAQVSG